MIGELVCEDLEVHSFLCEDVSPVMEAHQSLRGFIRRKSKRGP